MNRVTRFWAIVSLVLMVMGSVLVTFPSMASAHAISTPSGVCLSATSLSVATTASNMEGEPRQLTVSYGDNSATIEFTTDGAVSVTLELDSVQTGTIDLVWSTDAFLATSEGHKEGPHTGTIEVDFGPCPPARMAPPSASVDTECLYNEVLNTSSYTAVVTADSGTYVTFDSAAPWGPGTSVTWTKHWTDPNYGEQSEVGGTFITSSSCGSPTVKFDCVVAESPTAGAFIISSSEGSGLFGGEAPGGRFSFGVNYVQGETSVTFVPLHGEKITMEAHLDCLTVQDIVTT